MRWFFAFVATVTVSLAIAMPDVYAAARENVSDYVAASVSSWH